MAPQVYPSGLSNDEWALLVPLIPSAKPGVRPRTVEIRRIRERPLLCPAEWLCLAVSAGVDELLTTLEALTSEPTGDESPGTT